MFYVKVKLKESKIHGIGLFADEDIPKGKTVYSDNNKLDLFLSEKEFSSLADNEKNTIKHYGFFDKSVGKWHLNFDDMRFCNHSLDGNITLRSSKLIAKKDIKKAMR
jgi:uncharacterized cupin superfamily protein